MWNVLEKIFNQYGFNAILLLSVGYGCYKLIVWTIKQSTQREQSLQQIISDQTLAWNKHTEQAKDFHTEVNVAHEYQRKEHDRMINILDGIKDAVARINGYKHE
jgi:hypothetical protein